MTAYKKHADPQIDAALSEAEWFGNVRVGGGYLFHRKVLTWRYIALENVKRAWRRVEECKSRTGCCSNDFSLHFLVLEATNGETISLKIGEALYRHEPELLIEKLKKEYPEITIGKN